METVLNKQEKESVETFLCRNTPVGAKARKELVNALLYGSLDFKNDKNILKQTIKYFIRSERFNSLLYCIIYFGVNRTSSRKVTFCFIALHKCT